MLQISEYSLLVCDIDSRHQQLKEKHSAATLHPGRLVEHPCEWARSDFQPKASSPITRHDFIHLPSGTFDSRKVSLENQRGSEDPAQILRNRHVELAIRVSKTVHI